MRKDSPNGKARRGLRCSAWFKMKPKPTKRKDCVQRLAEHGSAAGRKFERALLRKMGLSEKGAELVEDSLMLGWSESRIMEETLRGISASPRNRGARRYARATMAFIDALRDERAKQPNDQAQRACAKDL